MEKNNPLLIVVDPGHGGDDYGAMWEGRLEKDDNLRLGLLVRDALMNQGVDVLMTRDTDVFIPLADRARMANDADADLFVSLHRNSYHEPSPTAQGVENYIYLTAPEATTGRAARLVLDEVVNVGVQSDRGVNRGNYYVLRRTKMPAMLLEMGFIINDIDNQLFDQNLEAYAQAIAKGVMEYFGLTYQPPNVQPPVVQPVPPIGTLPPNCMLPPECFEPPVQPMPPIGTLPPVINPLPPVQPIPPIGTLPPVINPLPPVQPVPPIGTLPPVINPLPPVQPVPPIGTLPPVINPLPPVQPVPPIGTLPTCTAPPTGTFPSFRTDLINEAQRALNGYFGANLTVDGIYGPATRQALIRALQNQINQTRGATLALDGIVGPKTMALLPTLRQGDRGNLVVLLQIMLNLKGYDTGSINGTFDPMTRTAVELFQRDSYLIPDGVAGPRTIGRLLA